MKDIILSIDPFDKNRNVIEAGLAIAKKNQLKIVLHSAVSVNSDIANMPTSMTGRISTTVSANTNLLVKDANAKIQSLLTELKAEWPRVDTEVNIGFKADQVLEKESEQKTFLIILTQRYQLNWIGEILFRNYFASF